MNRLWMNSGDHHHVLDRLCCELNLTPDQKTKVEAILKTEDINVNKLRDMDRDKFRAIRDKIDAQIRPLLTPDQIKKLDALKELREHPPAKPGFWGSFWFLFHPMPPQPAGPDSAPCSTK
jgi:Spy/CpxP family protein refolding chaperone